MSKEEFGAWAFLGFIAWIGWIAWDDLFPTNRAASIIAAHEPMNEVTVDKLLSRFDDDSVCVRVTFTAKVTGQVRPGFFYKVDLVKRIAQWVTEDVAARCFIQGEKQSFLYKYFRIRWIENS